MRWMSKLISRLFSNGFQDAFKRSSMDSETGFPANGVEQTCVRPAWSLIVVRHRPEKPGVVSSDVVLVDAHLKTFDAEECQRAIVPASSQRRTPPERRTVLRTPSNIIRGTSTRSIPKEPRMKTRLGPRSMKFNENISKPRGSES